jgi:hypothetical protein
MSGLSPQSGAKRTLIRSRGASLFAAGRERALDANMIDFRNRRRVGLPRAPSSLSRRRTWWRIKEQAVAALFAADATGTDHEASKGGIVEGEHAAIVSRDATQATPRSTSRLLKANISFGRIVA